MRYGISGDHQTAKETFAYGLPKDPSYPMFHYNLACANAEMNDLDSAIVHLMDAFRYKDNMFPGEQLPDPRTDSSFIRYLPDAKFLHALAEIKAM